MLIPDDSLLSRLEELLLHGELHSLVIHRGRLTKLLTTRRCYHPFVNHYQKTSIMASVLCNDEIFELMSTHDVNPSKSVVLVGLPEKARQTDLKKCVEAYGSTSKIHLIPGETSLWIVEFSTTKAYKRIGELLVFKDGDYEVRKVTSSVGTAPPDSFKEELEHQRQWMMEMMEINNATILKKMNELIISQTSSSSSSLISPTNTNETVQPIASSRTFDPSVANESDASTHGAALTASQSDHLPLPSGYAGNIGNSYRIKSFSGSNPPKNGESTFQEWSVQIQLVLEDPTLSVLGKRQRLLGSLHSPALDMALTLGERSTAVELFAYIRRLYQDSSDGMASLKEFFSLTPTSIEKPSEYLIRLELALQKVRSRGGIRSEDINSTRLHQFRSTSRNQNVYNLLNARFPKGTSPTLPDLIDAVKEVERDDTHFKVRSCVQTTPSEMEEIQKLRSQVQGLHSLVNRVQQSEAGATKSSSPQRNEGRFRFCYNCGELNHISYQCKRARNAELVCKRLEEREKMYQQQRNQTESLNCPGSLQN